MRLYVKENAKSAKDAMFRHGISGVPFASIALPAFSFALPEADLPQKQTGSPVYFFCLAMMLSLILSYVAWGMTPRETSWFLAA